MKRTDGVLVVAAAIAALAGCGPSPARSNAPASASSACLALHAAAATRAARCSGGPKADWAQYYASNEDCAAYDRHVAAGEVSYRPDKFDACLAEYDRSCDHSFNCFYEVLHGMTADGQRCPDTEVCGTDSACFSVDGSSCGEVCVRGGVENETCGLYCGGSTPCLDVPFCRYDLVCVNNVCVKGKTAGDGCGGANACLSTTFCTADPADPQSTGTCTLPVSGGACRADTECPATDFCFQGACAVRRTLGVSCADAPTGCASFSVCDPSGTCVPAGKPGTPCLPFAGSPDPTFCWIGVCVNGTCVAPANWGEGCAAGVCAVGNACDTSTLMCISCPL